VPELVVLVERFVQLDREVTRVESTGVVKLKINIVTRNMKEFGYCLPLVAGNVNPREF
jgi:hypothetical protein